jgi:crossover junction endodeoxyribonuclease RusA
MNYVIVTPFARPPMSANDQRRAHWQKVRAAKKQVGDAVAWLARQQQIKDVGPAEVSFVWFAPDKRRRDSDSLGPFVKAALDGLVEAGVFPDDHNGWVVKTSMAVVSSDTRNPRIEISIKEISDG